MKLKENFALKQVANIWVVLPLAESTVDFKGMLKLNESGVLLWRVLEQGGDLKALVKALTDVYDVTEEIAAADAEAFLETLKNAGCLEA